MSIFYHLWKVWLCSNSTKVKSEEKCSAEISSTKFVKSNKEIAEQLANESDVGYNTLIYVMNQYERVVREMLCEGFTVKTNNVILTPAITGEWDKCQLEFQPENNKRIVDCKPTSAMIQALEFVDVKVMGAKDISAYISQVFDQKSGEVDCTLSRNGEIVIKGNAIKAIAKDGSTDNCIYLIKSDKTMIDIGAHLLKNDSEEIILQLPSGIEKGIYHLAIHTYIIDNNHGLLTQLHCIDFDKDLCVK